MSRIGSTEILGGIAVFVRGDLSQLKADIAEAKLVSASAEKMLAIKANLSLAEGSAARLGTEITRILRSVQQIASANPIRVPVILESRGGMGGALPTLAGGGAGLLLAPGMGSGGGSARGVRPAYPGEFTIGSPQGRLDWPGGAQRLLGVAADAEAISETPSPNRPSARRTPGDVTGFGHDTDFEMRRGGDYFRGGTDEGGGDDGGDNAAGGNGGGFGRGGGGIRGARSGMGWSSRRGGGLERAVRLMTLAHFVSRGLVVGADASDYVQAVQSGDTGRIEASRQILRGHVTTLPYAGPAGEAVGRLADNAGGSVIANILSAGNLGGIKALRAGVARLAGTQTDEESRQFEIDQQKQEQRIQHMILTGKRNAQLVGQTEQLDFAHRTIGMTGAQVNVQSARDNLKDFDTSNGANGLTGAAKDARKALVTAVGDAVKQEANEAAAELRSARTAAGGILGGASAGLTGITQGSVNGGRAQIVNANRTAANSALDEIQQLRSEGRGLADPKMQSAMMRAAATLAGGAMNLAGYNFAAKQDATSFLVGSNSRFKQNDLRASGNTDAADLESIREEYRQRKLDVEKTYGNGSPQAAAIDRERDQAIAIQSRHLGKPFGPPDTRAQYETFNTSLETRNTISSALGSGETTLASTAGRIGSLKGEMQALLREVGRNPELFTGKEVGQLASTQLGELGALKKQILQPNQYATENERFDVPGLKGGPGGTSGKDMIDAVNALNKTMDDLRNVIKNNGGGLPS